MNISLFFHLKAKWKGGTVWSPTWRWWGGGTHNLLLIASSGQAIYVLQTHDTVAKSPEWCGFKSQFPWARHFTWVCSRHRSVGSNLGHDSYFSMTLTSLSNTLHCSCFPPPRSKWLHVRVEIVVVYGQQPEHPFGCWCCILPRSWHGIRNA